MATIQQRDKMRTDGKRQFNIWLDADTAERLKTLSERTGKAYPALIADALLALEELPPDEVSSTPVPSVLLADQITEIRAALHSELAELNQRVSALENGARTALNGAVSDAMAEPLSYPYSEENGAKMAVSGGVVAMESSPAISAVPNEAAGLDALIASIPKADFLSGGNERRNRRILELHLAGKGISQISRVLMDEGISNSGGGSVEHFFKKHRIAPNRVGRRAKQT